MGSILAARTIPPTAMFDFRHVKTLTKFAGRTKVPALTPSAAPRGC